MAKGQKFYVVWSGKEPGIYKTWAECEEQVKGFKGARFKSYPNLPEAEAAFKGEESVTYGNAESSGYIKESISTDAACSGNPGVMEFQGVNTENGEKIFYFGPFPVGTNNIGEFLGIVEGIKYLQKENKPAMPIYTDSQTAIAWVRNKKVGSNLERNNQTEELWQMIESAIEWLRNNEYKNPIIKWDTPAWGEIKADFGNK
ncbi:ribonuclease H [Bacillus cereus]|uniref:Ribonuclease H n=1 Tax=Bacillus cereus TaxID=1396 RepID=A0A9X6SST6_BACCE|nr:ribonuclease H family protein [Bacillus cereus]PDZ94559.1 ribonuclease H [Bacillus cereus]